MKPIETTKATAEVNGRSEKVYRKFEAIINTTQFVIFAWLGFYQNCISTRWKTNSMKMYYIYNKIRKHFPYNRIYNLSFKCVHSLDVVVSAFVPVSNQSLTNQCHRSLWLVALTAVGCHYPSHPHPPQSYPIHPPRANVRRMYVFRCVTHIARPRSRNIDFQWPVLDGSTTQSQKQERMNEV